MSFYDLTKDVVLSAKQLFKYRTKRDNTIPSRGGQKEFEPDGTWMQTKTVEAFIQERTTVLGEPRVEKLKNLVEGVWDSEKNLVNLKKPGKFYQHMGFTDNRRNWLYPEEALFLMETNTLEVYCNGIPLSIQEAFNKFLGSSVSFEEYQVFSHLRRLGYIVMRHEEELVVTPYERQINLVSKRSKKWRKRKLGKDSPLQKASQSKPDSADRAMCPEDDNKEQDSHDEEALTSDQADSSAEDEPSCKTSTVSSDAGNTNDPNIVGNVSQGDDMKAADVGGVAVGISTAVSDTRAEKRDRSDEDSSSEQSSASKKQCFDSEDKSIETASADSCPTPVDDSSLKQTFPGFYPNSWLHCFQQLRGNCPPPSQDEDSGSTSGLKADFNKMALPLPDIAGKSIVSLVPPEGRLLPPNIEINEDLDDVLIFDVEEYRLKNPPEPLGKQTRKDCDRDERIRSLDFSFSEWTQRKPAVKASNWANYKTKVQERMQEMSSQTPADHLWKGKVTPLLKPQEAVSNQAILDRLSIIKSADNTALNPVFDGANKIKIKYDVHLPNSSFRKTMPGLPNHRISLAKCSSDTPSLAEIQHLWQRYKDNVPLHWAVVDSGEIAFYVFNNTQCLEVVP